MGKPLLIVVSGPSGAGKGTLCRALAEICDNIKISVSATTRKPRKSEIHGINYFFKTENEFEEMIKKNEFLEYAKIYDNYYATPRVYVNETLKKHDVLLEIDPQGAMIVKKNAPDALFLFVVPPSLDELFTRLKARGSENEKSFKTRIGSVISELDTAVNYDYIVINDEVEKAVMCMKNIIEAEKCSTKRRREFLDNLKEGKY